MEAKYVMCPEESKKIQENQRKILESTQEAYKKMEVLKKSLKAYPGWEAKDSKGKVLLILDLISQFHRDFCTGGNSPFEQFTQSFAKLTDGVNNYTGNAKSYRELEGK